MSRKTPHPADVHPLVVDADYHRHPLGNWTADLSVNGTHHSTVQGAGLDDVFDAVLHTLEHLANQHHQPCSTIHTLDGDPETFMTLAEQTGLATPSSSPD